MGMIVDFYVFFCVVFVIYGYVVEGIFVIFDIIYMLDEGGF